jgi:hypothetical protein
MNSSSSGQPTWMGPNNKAPARKQDKFAFAGPTGGRNLGGERAARLVARSPGAGRRRRDLARSPGLYSERPCAACTSAAGGRACPNPAASRRPDCREHLASGCSTGGLRAYAAASRRLTNGPVQMLAIAVDKIKGRLVGPPASGALFLFRPTSLARLLRRRARPSAAPAEIKICSRLTVAELAAGPGVPASAAADSAGPRHLLEAAAV